MHDNIYILFLVKMEQFFDDDAELEPVGEEDELEPHFDHSGDGDYEYGDSVYEGEGGDNGDNQDMLIDEMGAQEDENSNFIANEDFPDFAGAQISLPIKYSH